ncbi:MutS-related protein [Enterococcus sp. LJL128]
MKNVDQRVWYVIGLSVAVVIIILFLEWRTNYKLREKIKQQWGKAPVWSRFDHEDSLKDAWKIAQTYQKFESEIDDITWYDLDMTEVFEAVNGTYSSIGSEALYQRLRNFDFNDQSVEKLEELIAFYEEQPEKRVAIQFRFGQLGKKDKNFVKHYLSEAAGKELPHFYLYVFFGILPIIGAGILAFGQVFGLYLLVGSICLNTFYYLSKKERLETELNSMRYFVQGLGTAKAISKIETPVQQQLKSNLTPLKSILTFAVSFRVKSNSEAEMLFDYINIMFMLPFISYHFALRRLAKHNKEAIILWDLLGELEAAYAVLNFRLYMPKTAVPKFQTGGVSAENSYHPLLSASAVVNPVAWENNTLVTGSNASGKSTYVKSVAINCILAQTIHTAAADHFLMQRGHVLTSMAVEDDLFEGDSYFVAEIKSIKRVLDQVATGEHCYCFIDEILKGTNTIERIAASASIIDWLKDYPSIAFVATHDIELTEILKYSCTNLHFEEQIEADGISFDYQVRSGAAKTRNALELLQVMSYPKVIVDSAKEEAAFFDKHRLWNILNTPTV